MMALSFYERKERLGYGGLTRIARRTKRSLGHVSQVMKGGRRDPRVERAIARAIGEPVEDVFPEFYHPQSAA